MATKQQIQLIHIAKSKLGLDDELYRQVLANLCAGKTSSKQLTIEQADAVLEHFKEKGFKPTVKPAVNGRRMSPKAGSGKVAEADKIRAIWITMSQQGFVRDSSETALDKFVAKVTGVAHVGWLKTNSAAQALEALKKWHARKMEQALAPHWGEFAQSRLYITLDDYRRLGHPVHGGRWYEALCALYRKHQEAK
ncbi:gp16 family protein [Gallaecimonas mangrovi]|uniref:gp16 family protein n=1 Tax=Gallaecimonas mangrovi TaxID=2291597 RepID=UPI000E20BD1D|nr:regulatory protein GemA [Gallaecimonas mangrovi]